jgi:putative transposase
LGTQTALTLFDGVKFQEITNPRFTQQSEEKIRKVASALLVELKWQGIGVR